jgi:multiple antibiotic resistance protein
MMDVGALLRDLGGTLGSLLVVIDPLTTIAPFLSLTLAFNDAKKHAVIRLATLIMVGVLLTFMVVGPTLLRLMGVSPLAFRIAGAALFAGIGWEALHAELSTVQLTAAEEREVTEEHPNDIAIIPLAFPLLCGPAALSFVLAQTGPAASNAHRGVMAVAILLAGVITYGVLRAAKGIGNRLGQTGINVLTRVAGLLLLTMAAQWGLDAIAAIRAG